MRNKIVSVILALVIAQIAVGQALQLENYTINNTHVVSKGSVYEILAKTETFFDGKSLKSLVIEDQTKIQMIQARLDSLRKEKAAAEAKLEELEEAAVELNATLGKAEGTLGILEKQKAGMEAKVTELDGQISALEEEITGLEGKKEKLESDISANVILSPGTYRIAVAVFIILILAAVVVKGRDFLGSEEGKEKKKNNKHDKAAVFSEGADNLGFPSS